MIAEICFGIIIIAGVLYFLWTRSAPATSFEKKLEGGKSKVVVKTAKPLSRIALSDKADGEKLLFIRNNIAKGETVEFIYPPSQDIAQLTVDDDTGTNIYNLSPGQKLEYF